MFWGASIAAVVAAVLLAAWTLGLQRAVGWRPGDLGLSTAGAGWRHPVRHILQPIALGFGGFLTRRA